MVASPRWIDFGLPRAFGAKRQARNARWKLDTFAALTVPTMCPLVCCAASRLTYPQRDLERGRRERGQASIDAELLRLAPPEGSPEITAFRRVSVVSVPWLNVFFLTALVTKSIVTRVRRRASAPGG